MTAAARLRLAGGERCAEALPIMPDAGSTEWRETWMPSWALLGGAAAETLVFASHQSAPAAVILILGDSEPPATKRNDNWLARASCDGAACSLAWRLQRATNDGPASRPGGYALEAASWRCWSCMRLFGPAQM